jgi:hypothetical protein
MKNLEEIIITYDYEYLNNLTQFSTNLLKVGKSNPIFFPAISVFTNWMSALIQFLLLCYTCYLCYIMI